MSDTTDQVARLVVQVDSDKVTTANSALGNLTASASKAETATKGLMGGAASLAVKLAGLAGAALSLHAAYEAVVASTEKNQALQAKVAASGVQSNQLVKEMVTRLREMETVRAPVEDLTEAFVLLRNRGLDPSSTALLAYRDLAAGTGNSVSTVANAIAQSSQGMYRALNQLGIRAMQESDGLRVVFRGNAEKIKGDAASIEAYVQKIATQNFGGASGRMDGIEIMATAMHDLEKAWGGLWRAVGESGIGDLIVKGFGLATDAVHELTTMVASGQLQGYIQAIIDKFDAFGVAAVDAINFVHDTWTRGMHLIGLEGDSAFTFLLSSIKNLPENVTAVVKGIGASLGLLVEYAVATGRGMYAAITGYLNFAWESAKNIGHLIVEAIKNPQLATAALGEYVAKQTADQTAFAGTLKSIWTSTTDSIGNATDAYTEEITAIMNERDAALKSFNDKTAAADKLRAAYDAVHKAGPGKLDPLKGEPITRGTDTATEAQVAAYEALKNSLQLEEKAIQDSYTKRLALIRNMTKAGSKEQVDMERALNQQLVIDMDTASAQRLDKTIQLEQDLRDAVASGNLMKVDQLRAQLDQENQKVAEAYEFRKQLILNATGITEEERQKKLVALETRYTAMQRQLELARNQATLATAADFFGNLSKAASAFGSKGAKIAKAAAIVQATIKTYESATSAYAALAGIPYIGPALGAAAAAAAIAGGMANIAQIRAQDYSGAYAMGGSIPAGKYGLVGEAGIPELVQGPATVTGGAATAALLRGGGTTINIINNAGVDVSTQTRDTDDGQVVEVLLKKVEDRLSSGLQTGGTKLARTMEGLYRLNRANA
jgi:hypothetical protein